MHISDGDLEIYLLDGFGLDQRKTFESHLRDCMACAIRLTSANILFRHRTPLVLSGSEKRNQPRTATDIKGVLQQINPFSAHRFNVRVIDTSTEGMRIESPLTLEPGTLIKLRTKDKLVFGEVRHCRAIASVFHAGIQLQNEFPV